MIKRDSDSQSAYAPSRRSLLRSTAALLSVPLIAETGGAWAKERLAGSGEVVVWSPGGSFAEGVRRNCYDPFTEATGIKVVTVVADLAEPLVWAMHKAGRIDWDIAPFAAHSFPRMDEAGMFVPIDYSLWDQEALEGCPPQTRLKDAVVQYGFAMLLAYDERAFPNGGPKNWADFWDVKRFPGPRGYYAAEAQHAYVPPLVAAGVASKDIWPLTDDKLALATKKLDEIKPHITKWWSAGGECTQLLINQELALTQAWDGRCLTAIRQGAPIKIVWEGTDLAYSYRTILKGGPNTANAQKLIAFLNRAEITAGGTLGTGLPGPNTHQLKYLPADLLPLLNANPENASKCVLEDSAWLAAKRPDGKSNIDYLNERWLEWRAH